MEDNKGGCKKEKRRDAAEVREKATPVSIRDVFDGRSGRPRSPSGVIAVDSEPFLNPTTCLVVTRRE
jgi:hypothetical protein